MKNLNKIHLIVLLCCLVLTLFTFQISATEQGVELGTQTVEASLGEGCQCPNGYRNGSGSYDWGAIWKFCDDCETVKNREAGDSCDCPIPGEN